RRAAPPEGPTAGEPVQGKHQICGAADGVGPRQSAEMKGFGVRLLDGRQPASAFLQIAAEALGRYKLRTLLSTLGIVLGVAAVIAMMSVNEGARRDALEQLDAIGLDNLVARSRGSGITGVPARPLAAGDVGQLGALVPLARAASPLVERYLRLAHGDRSAMARVLGVSAT